jgi:hypothetical protein
MMVKGTPRAGFTARARVLTVMRHAQGLLLHCLSAGMLVSSAAQSAQPQEKSTSPNAARAGLSQHETRPWALNAVPSGREAEYLRRLWGIDDIHVRYTASGALIRFSYRVVDAGRAKILNDKRTDPYLIVRKTGAKLEVPETEKVGKLRQTAAPEKDREYWMMFTNVGRSVKPGDHVDIVVGRFRANELVVESPGRLPWGAPGAGHNNT